MAISKQNIEEIRSASDIVEVLGSYLTLKRGGSAYKTNCPFHKEKTPSFSVNPQRQIYHCFGCGAGGDVFKFVMEYEGVDFITAAKMLAHRSGLHIEFDESDRGDGPSKDVLYAIHHEIAQAFRKKLLESDEAATARKYLEQRALDEATAEAFGIGYAPEKWNKIYEWAKKKKYSQELLEQAGLIAKSDRGGGSSHYARFRDRLMFPIHDEMGRVIAFSGRLLSDKKQAAKYVNSPETPLFHKSRVLYAMDKARKPMLESRTAIVCEGQIDVIRCHQAGLNTAVAPQGTALTEAHARILKRYADSVVMVFDADKAGQDAALRSAELCLAAGLSVRIASLPEGQDPDSLIRDQGADAFMKLVKTAQSVVDFQVDILEARDDLSEEVGIMRAAKDVLHTITHAQTAVQMDQLLRQASARLGVSEEALKRDLQRHLKSRDARYGAEDEAPVEKRDYPKEELVLAELLTQHPDVADMVQKYLALDDITDGSIRTIIRHLMDHANDPDWNLTSVVSSEDDTLMRLVTQVQMHDSKRRGETFTPEREAQDLILCIKRKSMEREKQDVSQRLKQASGQDRETLEHERAQLTDWIHKLRGGWEVAEPILDL